MHTKQTTTIIARVLAMTAGMSASWAIISGSAWAACPDFGQGGDLNYLGGNVTVTELFSDSGAVSELGLYSAPNPASRIDLSSVTPLGTPYIMLDFPANPPGGSPVVFDPSAFGIVPGPILFGIRVSQNDSQTYFVGSGALNPDGIAHAIVTNAGGGNFDVFFEDLFGGGDCDFNDNNFRFHGGITQDTVARINIKPESDPNSINICSNGATPVLIWGSDTVDVALIDPLSLVLASSSVKTVGKKDRSLCSIEDRGAPDEGFFDGIDFIPDGYDDLTCHFVTFELTDLDDVSTEAQLTGALCDDPSDVDGCQVGDPGFSNIIGSDAVNIVKDCS